MQKTTKILKPRSDQWLFLPLGGSGEIGMNLNLYGYDGKWLMLDLGITFGNDTTPGIEVIMPDISFIEDNKQDLAGLVLTHAHDLNHLGAVPYLWPRLRLPDLCNSLYCSRFEKETGTRRSKGCSHPLIPMRGKFKCSAFSNRVSNLNPFHPRAECGYFANAFGHRVTYGRLEN